MPPSRKRKRPARSRAPRSTAKKTTARVRRNDPERVSREAVEALVSSLRPDEPLPRWRTHPADLTEFCAALVALGAPAVHDRDEVVAFAVRLKDKA